MKKYFLGAFALAMAITFSAFNTTSKSVSPDVAYAFWYPVNAAGETTSTTPSYTNKDEAFIIANQACKDVTSQICFAGSNSALALGTDVTGFPADRLVKKQ